MPLCAKCQNPFVCHCSAAVRKPLGAAVADCPLDQRPGAIWVHVTDDRGIDVKDADASNDGTIKPTDANGVAVYDPVPPGEHTVRLSHRSVEKLKLYEEPKKTTRKPTVVAGDITYIAYQLARRPLLKVKVVEKDNPAKLFEGAKVTVTGAKSPPAKDSLATGIADFGLVDSGDYKVKVELKADDQKTHATTLDFSSLTADFALAAGHDQELVVEAEPLNIVTPKIELEYKIVLFDAKMHESQAGDETKIFPGATRIEVSATQTNTKHPFTKTGKLDAPNCDVFTDEACSKPLTVDLTAAELIGSKPKALWLRGKTEGKFDLKLTLAGDPTDRFVKLAADPAKEEMGVVKLELKLHAQDLDTLKAVGMQVNPDTDPESTYYTNLHAKALPEQKLMGTADKIGESKKEDADKPGRLLHVQKDGHFCRAKLLVAKINDAHLPAGTDDYDIVLNLGRGTSFTKGADLVKPEELQGSARDVPNSGSLTLFDAETVGIKKENVSFKVSALKVAEQSLWVEGTTETDQACDVRLDVGMNRSAAGLANTVKRNGDWARFTVVKIEKVDIVDTRKAGDAAPQPWDAATKRYYINFKKESDGGRKVKFAATLSKRLKNISVHIMLAPDKDNHKTANWGIDLPSTWKWNLIEADVKHLDKADRKDFLHLSEKTNAEGVAAKELTLSRFGGDKFQAAAYIEQDPHLAKYVEGDSNLGTRKPVLMADKIEVYRKFWYREVKVAGLTVKGFGNAAETYKDVKVLMEAAPVVELPRAQANAVRPNVFYPKHMVRYHRDAVTNAHINSYPNDTGEALVVGDDNESQFMSRVVADAARPVEIPIMNVHGLWAADGMTGAIDSNWVAFNSTQVKLMANKKLLDPPLQGDDLLVPGGTWESCRAVGGTMVVGSRAGGNLDKAHVKLDPARNSPMAFVVEPPVAPGPDVFVRINCTLRGAMSFLGTSYRDGIVNCYTPNDEVDFVNTINHEIAHSFKQVAKVRPAGVPAHPHQYDRNGSHCSGSSNRCVMFESGPVVGSLNRFCPVCHPYVLTQTMRTA